MSIATAESLGPLVEQRRTIGPDWVNRARRDAAELLVKQGVPTRKLDAYRYTELAQHLPEAATLAGPTEVGAEVVEPYRMAAADAELVFVNGQFHPGLSRLDSVAEGLALMPLSAALERMPDVVEKAFGYADPERANFTTRLNQALFSDGLFVHACQHHRVGEIIHALFLSTGAGDRHVRNVVVAEADSHFQVVEHHVGLDAASGLSTSVSEVIVEADADLRHCRIQQEGGGTTHLSCLRGYQRQDSRLETFHANFGSAAARNDTQLILDGTRTETSLDGLTAVRGRQHIDNDTFVHHIHENCNSSQLYKTILRDASVGVFTGSIRVEDTAQKTDAYQLNQALLLSPDALMNARPQLEIFADDVRCTHGATVGPVNSEERFYLLSRGIPPEQAEAILARGFLQELLDDLPIAACRGTLVTLLDDYFGG